MKNAIKGKKANLMILILILLVLLIQAIPAISYGENGQPTDGTSLPPLNNSKEMVSSIDFLLLSLLQSVVI